MSLRIRVSPGAEADLAGAYAWYEQAQTGLGAIFLDSVDQALQRVAEFPESGRIVEGDIRRALTSRFSAASISAIRLRNSANSFSSCSVVFSSSFICVIE